MTDERTQPPCHPDTPTAPMPPAPSASTASESPAPVSAHTAHAQPASAPANAPRAPRSTRTTSTQSSPSPDGSPAPQQANTLGTLADGLATFETLVSLGRPASLAELTDRLERTKSSLHATLNTLVACGWLVRTEDARYFPSPKIISVGYAWALHLQSTVDNARRELDGIHYQARAVIDIAGGLRQ